MKRGVAAGLVLASVGLVGVLSAQYVIQPGGRAFYAGSPAFPMQAWPPHPSDIVNVNSCEDPTATMNCQVPGIAPGSYHVIYQVPIDRFLVVSRATWDGGGLRLESSIQGSTTVVSLYPDNPGFPGERTVGYVFEPGSAVVLANRTAQSPVNAIFEINGYLVDE